jgi:hypothetical protein
MNEKSIGQVEVFSIAGEKYVIGKSLAGLLGVDAENFDKWFKDQKEKMKIVRGLDYINSEEGILFCFEAATLIFEKNRKMEKTPRGRRRRSPYPLDEYGLPILPPQKWEGPFINPFAWARRDEPPRRPLDKRAALIYLLEDAAQSRPRRCRYPTQKPAWMELLDLIRADSEE